MLHGLLEAVGVLLEAAERVLGAFQRLSGCHWGCQDDVGWCWGLLEWCSSQRLLGCSWGLLGFCQGAAESCWGGAGVLTGVVRGYWGVPEWCEVVLGAAEVCQGLPGPPPACSSPFSARQLEQFKKDNEDIGFGSGTRALEQALERTRANINWVKENQATVLTWFEGESS